VWLVAFQSQGTFVPSQFSPPPAAARSSPLARPLVSARLPDPVRRRRLRRALLQGRCVEDTH